MNLRRTWMLPMGFLLLGGLTGCPTKTPTTTPASKAAPLPGCRVERLVDAEQAVRQLRGHSQAYVYKIDGDAATCKLEVFYKPDEESEETLVWSATGDGVVDGVKVHAEGQGIRSPHKYHHFLAIVVPEYPPKPDDQFVFSFCVRCTSSEGGKKSHFRETFWDSKEVTHLFPDSLMAVAGKIRVGGSSPTPQSRSMKPGEKSILVDTRHWWAEQGQTLTNRRDFVRYQITVTCLEDGELPAASDQEKDEEEPK